VPRADDLAARVDRCIAGGPSDTAEPFDAMFDGGNTDPWRLDSSFYEQRRLALVLACLGRDRYQSALEIGCSTGQLSELLANRVDDVTGLDASASALHIAQHRCPKVTWTLGVAPADIPQRRFDLIVLSEVAYFLDGPDLVATLRAAQRLLQPGGEIVLANWRAATSDIPLDGELVHQQAAAVLDLPLRSSYCDADLTIQLWGEPVSVHQNSEATA
jgi:SAM-dependent methyltransferase